jgi:hypothetical protein
MRLPLAAAAALLAAAAQRSLAEEGPRAAAAAPEGGPRAVIAARLAVAPAFGSAAADVPVSDAVALQLPAQLDAMLEVRRVAVGAYGSWGWGRVDACAGSCSASVKRAGLQATWTLPPVRGADPWVGLAAGYEWATARRARGATDVETTWRGWELFAVQGGVEWRLGPAFALGPFLLAGVGRYSGVSVDTGLDAASGPIPERSLHVWTHVGVRARFHVEVAP